MGRAPGRRGGGARCAAPPRGVFEELSEPCGPASPSNEWSKADGSDPASGYSGSMFRFGEQIPAAPYPDGDATATPASSSAVAFVFGQAPEARKSPEEEEEQANGSASRLPQGNMFQPAASSALKSARKRHPRSLASQSFIAWDGSPSNQPSASPSAAHREQPCSPEHNPNEGSDPDFDEDLRDANEGSDPDLDEDLRDARKLMFEGSFLQALEVCCRKFPAESRVISEIAERWERAERETLNVQRGEQNSTMAQLNSMREKVDCARDRVTQLQLLLKQKDIETVAEREKRNRAERNFAEARRAAEGQAREHRQSLSENAQLRRQLAHLRRNPAQEDVAREVASVECSALRAAAASERAALRKKLLLKWHPDKQPGGGDNAILAKMVMQELQNQPEWEA